MLEMKSTLSKIIRMFEIIPSTKEVELKSDLILKTADGIYVKFKSRKV